MLNSARGPAASRFTTSEFPVDDIGAGVGMAFQRQQLRLVAAQMGGAIEDMRDETRLSQWKRIECVHVFNQAISFGEAR